MIQSLKIKTSQKDEVLDITDRVEDIIQSSTSKNGVALVFTTHTTCCITTADLDPGTDRDLIDAVRGMIPKIKFRHPHNPEHTPDHIISSIIGPSVSIPYRDKKLILGIWQRIVLVELDGPRERNVSVVI